MSKKTGEFCRVKIAGVDTECMIKDTDSEKNLIALRRIGNGQTLKVSPGEILPSMGKAARTKQEQESFKAGEIVFAKKNGAEEWAKVKIFETLDDGSGKKYAVVTFVDTGIEDSVWLDEVKPVKMWIVGDLCKALWSEDGVIYEGVVETIDESDGRKYAIVRFYGYGNCDSAWLEDLMESDGFEARSTQFLESGAAVEEEQPPSKEASVPVEWKVNDRCSIIYSKDGKTYEGTIRKFTEGGQAKIHLIGMGKEDVKELNDLKPSAGREARDRQRALFKDVNETSPKKIEDEKPAAKAQEIQAEVKAEDQIAWEAGMFCQAPFAEGGAEYEAIIKSIEGTGAETYAVIQCIGSDKEASAWLKDLKPSLGEEARNSQLKVNPFAEWKVGDPCRAVFAQDGLEYEGDIQEISPDDAGNSYAVVVFCGYGDIQSVWLTELMASHGEDARKRQISCSQEEELEIAVDGATALMPNDESKKPLNETAEEFKPTAKIQEAKPVVQPTAKTEETKPVVQQPIAKMEEPKLAVKPVVAKIMNPAPVDPNNNVDMVDGSGDAPVGHLEMKLRQAQDKIALLEEKVRVYEANAKEMRNSNFFLKRETMQLLLQLKNTIEENLHVEELREEKKILMDAIITHKANE